MSTGNSSRESWQKLLHHIREYRKQLARVPDLSYGLEEEINSHARALRLQPPFERHEQLDTNSLQGIWLRVWDVFASKCLDVPIDRFARDQESRIEVIDLLGTWESKAVAELSVPLPEVRHSNTDPRAEAVRLLEQAREDFDRLRRSNSIGVRLVHQASNSKFEGVTGYPVDQSRIVAFSSAGNREPQQRVDGNGDPLFRDESVLDATGKPILNSAGEAYDVVMPASRSVCFMGEISDFQPLNDVAGRAGKLIARIGRVPALAGLRGWRSSGSADIWWAVVFELAWGKVHPLLSAERQIWLPGDPPSAFLPYDLGDLQAISKVGLSLSEAIPENWLKRLPDAFMSVIPRAAAASFDTADYLLSAVKRSPTSDRQGISLRLSVDLIGSKKLAAQAGGHAQIRTLCSEMAVFLNSELVRHSLRHTRLPQQGDDLVYEIDGDSHDSWRDLVVLAAKTALCESTIGKRFRYVVYQTETGVSYQPSIKAFSEISKTAEGKRFHLCIDRSIISKLRDETIANWLNRQPRTDMTLTLEGEARTGVLVDLYCPLAGS